MFNNNLKKRFTKLLISINQLIESFFNSFQKYKKFKIKKNLSLENIDKKIALISGLLIIFILTYFLIPTFYNKDQVRIILQDQIYSKYNIKIEFGNQINYGLFPKPNFSSKSLSIIHNQKKLANSQNTKIYISFKNFFNLKNLKIKDLVIDKIEFNTNSKNINFFSEVLNSFDSSNKVLLKNGNLFYKDNKEDVVFLLKIKDLIFLRDKKNPINIMKSNFEIFNIPFKFDVKKDMITKEIFSSLSSKKIRLNIENEFENNQESIIGLINFLILNKKNSFNYEILSNSLNFLSTDGNFKGSIDFKPFYFFSNFDFNQLNTKKIFHSNSILWTLINSEIWKNQNLNANFNINFNKINNSQNLNSFILKTYLEEGNLKIDNSSIKWGDNILIKLKDIELNNEKNRLLLNGEVLFDFININNFYSYFQIKKKHRKQLKEIKLDFVYDLNLKKIILDNLKIDNNSDENINNFLNDYNSKDKNLFNKVTFRNFVKNFFNFYSG